MTGFSNHSARASLHGVSSGPANGLRNQPASEPVTLGRRGAARARLALPGRMVTFNGTTSCLILDVSETGAQIGCDEPPRVGAMAVIEFPPVEFFGNVAWALDTRFGMRFDEPLDREKVIELRRRADAYDRSERRHLLKMAEEFVTGRVQ